MSVEYISKLNNIIELISKTENKLELLANAKYILVEQLKPQCRKQVLKLIEFSKTQPAQGTHEWLEQRKNQISASDCGAALGCNEYKTAKEVLLEKCGGSVRFDGNDATFHGHTFEYVAAQIHEIVNNVKCHEASFLRHSEINFIGASPDKYVYTDTDGYLVEIKCPYRRYPNGQVKNYYWIQVQIQLNVTNLERCMFDDCRFIEITKNEYLEIKTQNPNDYTVGIIGEVHDNYAEKTTFIYPKDLRASFDTNFAEIQEYFNTNLRSKSKNYYFNRYIYWKLVSRYSVEILRDRKWWADSLPQLKKFWELVLYYRQNGIEELIEEE